MPSPHPGERAPKRTKVAIAHVALAAGGLLAAVVWSLWTTHSELAALREEVVELRKATDRVKDQQQSDTQWVRRSLAEVSDKVEKTNARPVVAQVVGRWTRKEPAAPLNVKPGAKRTVRDLGAVTHISFGENLSGWVEFRQGTDKPSRLDFQWVARADPPRVEFRTDMAGPKVTWVTIRASGDALIFEGDLTLFDVSLPKGDVVGVVALAGTFEREAK